MSESAAAFNYHAYLASREWALLREAVRERSGGICERCGQNPQDAVHHLTYARVGHEDLEDLQAICNPCHQYLSGTADVDPANGFCRLQSLALDALDQTIAQSLYRLSADPNDAGALAEFLTARDRRKAVVHEANL